MRRSRMRSITISPEHWAHYVIEWNGETGFPDSWNEFIAEKKLVIECCCGRGDFLAEEAKKYPEKTFVGIDYAEPVMQRAVKKMYESGLENVRLCYNDIHDILTNLPKNTPIERIYINFPDPWPKKRHWNRRIIRQDILHELHVLMQSDTELIMVTDHDGYAEWILALLEQNRSLFCPLGAEWYQTDMEEFHDSIYMNKARVWGHSFYYFRVKKA